MEYNDLKLSVGILAHVDAGKTTLSEALLYTSGQIRNFGRVDHGNAFLDTDLMERERGITIFSKNALLERENLCIQLIDTPGHVDFSAEMERTLKVLDYAILVVSGSDGVQGHTETLWRLLKQYRVPTFIFVNKMDISELSKKELLVQLQALTDNCVDFSEYGSPEFFENVSYCDESALEQFLETGAFAPKDLIPLIRERKLFPCFFGSALKLTGVDNLLWGLETFAESWDPAKHSCKPFSARVYKISRDENGNRLTWLKVTGGTLKVKAVLTNEGHLDVKSRPVPSGQIWQEKADQLRIYSGSGYTLNKEVSPGTVCAVTGLTRTFSGEALGNEPEGSTPILEPVLTYRVYLPEKADVNKALSQLRQLEEEDPMLKVIWDEALGEIHMQLMGAVQLEILQRILRDRYDLRVTFGPGNIMYKETIEAPSVGIGHFEPLRHYAEAHLLLTPGERGSGLTFDSLCSEDELDLNWQRLILTHLEEKIHRGVLTGSPITDMKISVTAGKAHVKHTEGGDFRQATYRAVRQGLMNAKSRLLEPWYSFRLQIPGETLGRAMSDIKRMSGSFDPPEYEGDNAILTGEAPVSEMREYVCEVNAYTGGKGRLSLRLKGYDICHNEEEVITEMGYDPLADPADTPDSVFCSHGVGLIVPWYEVCEKAHVEDPVLKEAEKAQKDTPAVTVAPSAKAPASGYSGYDGSLAADKELNEIFTRTFGPIKNRNWGNINSYGKVSYGSTEDKAAKAVSKKPVKVPRPKKEYLLVDGYNIIHAFSELKSLSDRDMNAAREALIEILSNYQGFKQQTVICVFDAYKVKGSPGSVEKRRNIYVVYTKEAETADSYIEKATKEIAGEHRVYVATSDRLEQIIVMGHGAIRLSASDLKYELTQASIDMEDFFTDKGGLHMNNPVVPDLT